MSFAIDTSVLVFASHAGGERHAAAERFLESCLRGSELFCAPWIVLMGYLRIVTSTIAMAEAMDPAMAQRNVASLLDLPHFRPLSEPESFWQDYVDLAGRAPVRGRLVPDAHVAAILKGHGVKVLYTNDRDFRRFDFLEVRDPFA